MHVPLSPLCIGIGTLTSLSTAPRQLPLLSELGFEGFQLVTRPSFDGVDLADIAARVEGHRIHALGIYGNTLTDAALREDLVKLIGHASMFGTQIVSCFAGAHEDRPVDENIPLWAQTFGELGRIAADHGVTLAFENCAMGGTWERPRVNIAHSPRAWEMMFDALPDAPLALEWEPCHQICSFVEPLAQLRKWLPRIARMHGKDAQVHHERVREVGILSGEYVIHHRFPGFGDTNWHHIFTILGMAGWTGAIDIEGHHDPVYRGDLEMTGQVASLRALQSARGGDYVPNPV